MIQAGMGSPRVFRGRGLRVRNHMSKRYRGDPFVPAPAQERCAQLFLVVPTAITNLTKYAATVDLRRAHVIGVGFEW